MRLVYITLFIILFCMNTLIANAEDKQPRFFNNAYSFDTESAIRLRINRDNTDKASKKKGKKSKLENDATISIDNEESTESSSDEKPPLFPCDPPVCRIIDESLSTQFCDNQCDNCQGRIDKRIWPYYFTVCIP